MRTIFRTLVIIMILGLSTSMKPNKNDESKNTTGINFYQRGWGYALEQAKSENKLIFLDIYATWCGPCKRLKANTFTNAEVGNLYNSNFINVALDGEKGEGLMLARKYGVRGYPTLLFVDQTGKVVARTAGYHDPDEFIELGKKVLNR